jgi:protein-disulfide isomerase-like protein with CxxC motif
LASRIRVTHFSDPGCPWAWSAAPALSTLQWRYGAQLEWRHVMIGLTEHGSQYEARGYTPLSQARGYVRFRRYGMPFSTAAKPRVAGTSRGCRAVVAVRLATPEREWAAFRALQLLQFCGGGLLDEDDDLRRGLAGLEGVDADAAVAAIDPPEVVAAYEADRAEARTAEGSPAEAQGRTATTDGPVRLTAPSLTFETDDGRKLTVGGFQHLHAYDSALANLHPALDRRPPATDVRELLAAFPDGLTTAEVAQTMATGPAEIPDPAAAEAALIEAVTGGTAERLPFGDGALWRPLRGC